MKRTWTEVGAEYTGGEDGWNVDFGETGPHRSRKAVEEAIDAMRWESPQGEKPMIPALAISHVADELCLPRLTAVAISNDLAPFGFYGLEAKYRNGRARVYVLDSGAGLTPLCSDFWEKEEVAS